MPPNRTYDERALLLQIAEGDAMSFGILTKHHWPQVYGTALRLTKSPEQAKDLAQEMFMKLWNSRHRLPEVENINTYIYVAARNLVMDFMEKKVFHPSNIQNLTDYLTDNSAEHPLTSLEFKELEQTVSAAIQALPEKTRRVFELHRFAGKSHKEIAALLDISEVSSKTYIVRALRDIRVYLSKHAGDNPLLLVFLLGKFF
ncbi:sigma-70 family RNA polymerase sigma factor [Pseudoflavitalea sp. G-6-1-2]|uniref:RNA polymerase sigma factor n=1 Tax=Pseudoflavitalea sp. G-6-1-2 TaxID=2728841 RepID=UPI00146AC632|nr:sigma-70 family RNA polymerase sigma factor [Pseudoflavitalea sp. G-6-1-2]NML22583.1 sigma-70 family RNA polymerase sigma factor [Pseudoflavitalea sp. G-6-1-2]